MNGLKPKDFRILEDGIQQKLSTFAEGNKPPLHVAEDGATNPSWPRRAARNALSDAFVGTNVFVLVRYQQLHVSRVRLRLGRDRRLCSGTRSRGLGRGLHVQPKSVACGDPEPRSQRRDFRPAQSGRGRRFRALQRSAC